MPSGICRIVGCGSTVYAARLCWAHYSAPRCKVDGCNDPACQNGYCGWHYGAGLTGEDIGKMPSEEQRAEFHARSEAGRMHQNTSPQVQQANQKARNQIEAERVETLAALYMWELRRGEAGATPNPAEDERVLRRFVAWVKANG